MYTSWSFSSLPLVRWSIEASLMLLRISQVLAYTRHAHFSSVQPWSHAHYTEACGLSRGYRDVTMKRPIECCVCSQTLPSGRHFGFSLWSNPFPVHKAKEGEYVTCVIEHQNRIHYVYKVVTDYLIDVVSYASKHGPLKTEAVSLRVNFWIF
jgi:hypothetical protein